MTHSENELPPCRIYIDKEGRWFHRGVEMVRREFVRSFYENLHRDAGGQYIITWQGKPCYVEVEDTAYVVRRVSRVEKGPGTEIQLALSDDSREVLMPETLYLGECNVIYCRVKRNTFPARFNRAAYYQLASYIETDGKTYFLPQNGRKYGIGEG